MANKNGNTLKWIGATAAGAVIGALAVRALDKYILQKEKKDVKQLEGEEQQQQGQGQQQNPSYYPLHGPQVMPVFLPFPTSPMMTMSAPMPPSLPAPSQSPPAQNPTVSEDEVDIVAEIEQEWDDD